MAQISSKFNPSKQVPTFGRTLTVFTATIVAIVLTGLNPASAELAVGRSQRYSNPTQEPKTLVTKQQVADKACDTCGSDTGNTCCPK